MTTEILLIILGVVAVVILVALVLDIRQRSARRKARSVGPRDRSLENPEWEAKRQAAVDASGILDTAREDRYDSIVTMARQLYGTDAAIFTVIDKDREWHKAMNGTDVVNNKRDTSFCSVTIRSSGSFVVGDASHDDRFVDQPLVKDDSIRFYAGYPVTVDGQNIGALCVFDSEPRSESDVDDSMLKNLASLIEAELRVDALENRRR